MKSTNKTTENDNSIEVFLQSITDIKRKEDALKTFAMMNDLLPEQAKMWGGSIIGFGSYHYKYESGREGDFLKVGFSPRKTSLTVYIVAGFERYEELMNKLGKYKTGKSCLYIKKLEDVDEEILKSLIKESYDYMTDKYG
jgi:hypothetical protein